MCRLVGVPRRLDILCVSGVCSQLVKAGKRKRETVHFSVCVRVCVCMCVCACVCAVSARTRDSQVNIPKQDTPARMAPSSG